MTLLEVNGLSISYADKRVVDNISFSLDEGEWLMLIGPNGAGKSSVVNAISRGVAYSGEIRYRNEDIKRFRAYEIARHLDVLSQTHAVNYPFTVSEVVRLGRYAYTPSFFKDKCECDEEAVQNALKLTGMMEYAERSVLSLSGGELQRTFLAQLFAQDPNVLILDEPTNNLDLSYQKETFGLLEGWLKKGERAIISVVHDLSLAKAYGTKALLLNEGKKLDYGEMDKVFSPDNLQRAYNMNVSAWMRELLSVWE